MTQVQLAADLTNDAVLYALGASLAFLVFVLVLDPKLARTPIGRTLIVLDGALAALYIPSVVHRFFGVGLSVTVFAWYYLVTVVLIGSATLWRTVIMVRAQARGRKPEA